MTDFFDEIEVASHFGEICADAYSLTLGDVKVFKLDDYMVRAINGNGVSAIYLRNGKTDSSDVHAILISREEAIRRGLTTESRILRGGLMMENGKFKYELDPILQSQVIGSFGDGLVNVRLTKRVKTSP